MDRINHLLNRINLRQLRLLVALSDEASVLRAAHSLGISQPAASKLLADLETELGGKLFERSNRGVRPNSRGSVLIRHAKRSLSQLVNGVHEVIDLNEGSGGTITVGGQFTALNELLPRAIALLRSRRPRVSIVVIEGSINDLYPRLQLGHVDLVVGRLPDVLAYPDLKHERLYCDEIRVLASASHPLALRPDLTLRDVGKADWILPPQETTVRRDLENAFRKRGLEPPRLAVQSISLAVTRRLLLETDMIGVLPNFVVEEDLFARRLVTLPIALPAAAVGTSHRPDLLLSPAAQGLLEALRSTVASLARISHEGGVHRVSD